MDRSIDGQVYAANASVDPETRTLQLRARAPNPDGTLRPGMFADVTMTLGTVDDAIVVLENIYAKIEEGKDTMTAGLEGTREIFFAVVAPSVSLVILFAPVIFMGGLTGQLFKEFGLVIAGAVAFSSFVALTLTPMLSTRLLKQRDEKPWIYRTTEPFFEALTDAYRRSLQSFMAHRWRAFVIMGARCAHGHLLRHAASEAGTAGGPEPPLRPLFQRRNGAAQ